MQEQMARMNGTRVFWDPTYTDSNYPRPNYMTDLNAIAPQAAATVTPPSGGGTTSTITYTFPAQSITLLVVPN